MLAVALAVVLGVRAVPSKADRLVNRTVRVLDEGNIEEADRALAELAEYTKDSIDLAAVVSIRLALSTARIARDNHLALEYFALASAYSEDDPQHQSYMETGQALQDALDAHLDDLMELARTYQGRHYQAGLRLKSPLHGSLQFPNDLPPEVDEAYWYLIEGDAAPEYHATLKNSVGREAIGATLRMIIVQDDVADAHTLTLAGDLDLAELWWLVGSLSPNRLFTEWSFNRVLEETADDPEHPARQRALNALSRIVHG